MEAIDSNIPTMEFNVYGNTKIEQSDDNKEFISYIKTILPSIIDEFEKLYDFEVYKWNNKPQIKMSNRWNSNSAYVEFFNKKHNISYQIRLSDHYCDGCSDNFIGDVCVDHINKNYDIDFDMMCRNITRHNQEQYLIIEEKQNEYMIYLEIVNNLPEDSIVAMEYMSLHFFENIRFSWNCHNGICDSLDIANELYSGMEYYNKQQMFDGLAEMYCEFIY